MDFTDVALTALQVVSPVLAAALTWAAATLASFIRSKVDNEYQRGVLVRLDDAVVTAVKDLQRTVVAEIKAARADGKISEAHAAPIVTSVEQRGSVTDLTEVHRHEATPGALVPGLGVCCLQ
jgi:hypothetical protein